MPDTVKSCEGGEAILPKQGLAVKIIKYEKLRIGLYLKIPC